MTGQEQTYSLRDILSIFFKHKYKIIFCFFPIVIITSVIALALPVHYVAKTVIMVKPGREFAPSSDLIANENKLPIISTETIVNTEIHILTSNDLIAKVVSTIGVYNIYPELKGKGLSLQAAESSAVERIIQDLLIKPVPGSSTIEIYCRNANPKVAANLANALTQYLNDKHLEVFGTKKTLFIEEQLKANEVKYRESMNKLNTFKETNQITSIKEQYWFIIGKRTELESTLKIEESKLEELRKKISFLKSQKKKAVADLYTAHVGGRLVDLEAKETQLLATYKENSRPVINLRKEIQRVKDALRQYEEEQKESQEWSTLEADVGPQNLKIENLRQQIIRLDKQLASLSSSSEELNRLERDVAVSQTNYEAYLKRHEEQMIAEDMDRRKITNIQVVERASVPVSPVKANQRRVIGIGMFLAAAASLGLAYLAEYLPQCMTTPEAMNRRLRLPVLIAVSYKMPRR
ncbi:MAG: Wzz/FepE/Etk N-terminal domain-containing protein [Proteobacteria bacterium]|nr:Wzz/FepE/Etk N-terminal domain-containing protein [Pseudomonadota bacterium]